MPDGLFPDEWFAPDGSVWSLDLAVDEVASVRLRQVFPSGGGLPPADAELIVPGPVLALALELLASS